MANQVTRIAALSLAVVLTAGCGQGLKATAIPDGDAAAEYVTAKFSAQLDVLEKDFTGNEARKSKIDKFARIDDKKMDSTIEAFQVGRPPARLAKNHSNRNSNEFLDSYHPAGSPIEYLLLGPIYTPLAPTPWVSMPYKGGNYNACFWEGYQDVCKMLTVVSRSFEKGAAGRQAKSFPDGTVELTAEVPLQMVLDERVIAFPEDLLSRVTDEMKKEPLSSKIILDGAGKLRQLDMTGLVKGEGHELEIRTSYQVLGEPTESELPKIPDPAQVTNLVDEAAIADFYDRMGAIQDG